MRFENVSDIVSFVASKAKTLPQWQRELFSQYREEVQVHSNGLLFYKVDRLFPNEHPDSKAHRILAFEAITKGSFWKGVNNVTRVFQNSSYSVEASENTVAHVTSHNFDKQNLFSFFLKKWCETALANDPNAVVVVYPFEFMQGKKFSQVSFISSEHIEYQDDETVVFISEEESEKRYENSTGRTVTATVYDQALDRPNIVELNMSEAKNTYTKITEVKWVRRVYHVFTDMGFYRIAESEEGNGEYTYEFYMHNKNFMPVFKVGGMEAAKGVARSFFSVFCPFGNLALLQHSQHTAVNFMFSFPRMSEIETPCEQWDCKGKGYVVVDISDAYPDGKKQCAVCRGTGYSTKQSPYKTYQRRFEPDKFDNGTISALNFDDVKFYTPDTNILNYSKKEWKDYLDLAEQAVYVPQEIMTGQVQSAKSKDIDRDDRYNFHSAIGKVFYDCLRNVIQAYEVYMNARPVEVAVNIPFSMAIENEMDTFEALQTILASDAPIVIKANKIETFINKFVSQSSPVRRFFNILKKVDLLLFYSDSQIAAQKIGGVVNMEQWAKHVYSFPVLSQMYYADRAIFDLDDDAIIKKLEAELKPLIPDQNMLKSRVIDAINNPQNQE